MRKGWRAVVSVSDFMSVSEDSSESQQDQRERDEKGDGMNF
jgi:hypothetical protein